MNLLLSPIELSMLWLYGAIILVVANNIISIGFYSCKQTKNKQKAKIIYLLQLFLNTAITNFLYMFSTQRVSKPSLWFLRHQVTHFI